MEYTQEQIKSVAHLSNEEIEKDIADTEAEIYQMEKQIPGHKILAEAGDRYQDILYRAKVDGVVDRKQFIEKLKAILRARNAKA